MKNRLSIALVMSITTGVTKLEMEGILSKEQADKISELFDKNLYTLLDGKEVEVQSRDGKVVSAKLTATDPLFSVVEQQINFLINREEIPTKGYTE